MTTKIENWLIRLGKQYSLEKALRRLARMSAELTRQNLEQHGIVAKVKVKIKAKTVDFDKLDRECEANEIFGENEENMFDK